MTEMLRIDADGRLAADGTDSLGSYGGAQDTAEKIIPVLYRGVKPMFSNMRFCSTADIDAKLRRADIVLSPSDLETAWAAVEAIQCGLSNGIKYYRSAGVSSLALTVALAKERGRPKSEEALLEL